MPALFAYLFSVIIFIGGGYAGLVWLTEPPAAVPTVVATAKAHGHARRNREAGLSPDVSGARSVDTEQAPPARQAEAAKPDVKPDTLSADAVREPDASPPPDQAEGKKPDDQTPGVGGPPKDTQADRIKSADNQEPAPSKAVEEAQTAAVPNHDTTTTHQSVRPSRPRRIASIRNGARAENTTEQRQARRTSRSHLVMMTLQTLEFADGHREERLMPFHRSGAGDEN